MIWPSRSGRTRSGCMYKNPDELEDLCDSGRYIHGLWSPYGKQDEIWLNKELKGTMALERIHTRII